MTVVAARLAPPNSLILILDPSLAQLPLTMNGALISSTATCVAVGCQAESDGETDITLGDASEVDPGTKPSFEGQIQTPAHRIEVQSIYGAKLLEMPVSSESVIVRLWVNDADEPDQVIIGLVR